MLRAVRLTVLGVLSPPAAGADGARGRPCVPRAVRGYLLGCEPLEEAAWPPLHSEALRIPGFAEKLMWRWGNAGPCPSLVSVGFEAFVEGSGVQSSLLSPQSKLETEESSLSILLQCCLLDAL